MFCILFRMPCLQTVHFLFFNRVVGQVIMKETSGLCISYNVFQKIMLRLPDSTTDFQIML